MKHISAVQLDNKNNELMEKYSKRQLSKILVFIWKKHPMIVNKELNEEIARVFISKRFKG